MFSFSGPSNLSSIYGSGRTLAIGTEAMVFLLCAWRLGYALSISGTVRAVSVSVSSTESAVIRGSLSVSGTSAYFDGSASVTDYA